MFRSAGMDTAEIAEHLRMHEAVVSRALSQARAARLGINGGHNATSKSEAQGRLIRAAAASPAVRAKTGITKKVAAEFNRADPGGKLPAKVRKPRK